MTAGPPPPECAWHRQIGETVVDDVVMVGYHAAASGPGLAWHACGHCRRAADVRPLAELPVEQSGHSPRTAPYMPEPSAEARAERDR